jgi:hypothetical protein
VQRNILIDMALYDKMKSGKGWLTSQQAKIALDDRQMNHSEKMHGQLLKAGGKTAAFLEPADAAFNDIATTIAFLIVADRSSHTPSPTPFAWRYHRSDPMPTQPVANALRVIGFITTNAPRSQTWSSFRALHLHATDQCLELGRLVRLSWQQQRTQGHTSRIDKQVQFAAKSAYRAS